MLRRRHEVHLEAAVSKMMAVDARWLATQTDLLMPQSDANDSTLSLTYPEMQIFLLNPET